MDSIQKYRELPYLNQGAIKAFILGGIHKYNSYVKSPDTYKLESDVLKLGNAIDCKLTNAAEYDNKYIVMENKIDVPDKIKLACIKGIDFLSHMDISKMTFNAILKEVLIPCARDSDYRSNIKNEDVYIASLIKDNIESYFYLLYRSKGKEILSYSESMMINLKCKEISDTFPHIFNNTNPNINVLFQHMFVGKIDGIDIKILPDIVVINKETKQVYIYDLKTMEDSVVKFKYSYKRFLYNIQEVVYSYILQQNLPEGYTLNKFKFLVASTTDTLKPQMFSGSPELLLATLEGSDNHNYKSVRQAIKELDYHIKNKLFDVDLPFIDFKHKTNLTVINNNFEYSIEY